MLALLTLLAVTGVDPIDAYLAPARAGETVIWENHHRRVIKDGACVAECDELDPARLKDAASWQPATAPSLVVVDVAAQKARVIEKGRTVMEVRVAFGQALGVKERQGDNKTPRGRYTVTKKHKGEFSGMWGAYYGGHWVKVSYPNAHDARRGRARGLIDAAQAQAIITADARGELPPQNTKLGGGIGFHGWIEEWADPAAGADPLGLSWGCVVLHLSDVGRFYDAVEAGAVVVIR